MISTFTALIDANVFYKSRLRSLILWAAQTDLFRARWTNKIHEEWMQNLLERRPDLTRESLERTRQAMDRSIEDCLVAGYELLIDGLTLPDPDDRHVLAAAIAARANVIVTFNLTDFPEDTLKVFGLHVCHPDDFLLDVASISAPHFITAARDDFRHYENPPLTMEDYLTSLENAGVPKTAAYLRSMAIVMKQKAVKVTGPT